MAVLAVSASVCLSVYQTWLGESNKAIAVAGTPKQFAFFSQQMERSASPENRSENNQLRPLFLGMNECEKKQDATRTRRERAANEKLDVIKIRTSENRIGHIAWMRKEERDVVDNKAITDVRMLIGDV